jgi:hypothetical protein
MINSAGTHARVASDCFSVTPSNTVLFGYEIAGIYVGGAGNITVIKRNGLTVLFTAVPQGSILPVCCVGVNATGTTATLLVGLV